MPAGARSIKKKRNRALRTADKSSDIFAEPHIEIDQDTEAKDWVSAPALLSETSGEAPDRKIEHSSCSLSRRELAKADLVCASTPGARPAVKGQTLLGANRLELIAIVTRLPQPQISKQRGNFRLATARKLAEKTRAGTWWGWSQEVPRPRLGGAAADGQQK